MRNLSIKLDDFKVLNRLGSKNTRKFNSVYLVENISNGEKGVLKTLTKSITNQYVQDLLRFESSLIFKSKFLPDLIGYYEDNKTIAAVFSFREGITLKEYFYKLDKSKRLNFVVLFLEKLVPIFEELKCLNLVHGDIRPSNIIISGNDLMFEVYLIDFGLSFCHTDKTLNRKLVFPLAYAAPELILNKLHLANQSTDLYALSICLFQLFTNKLPFTHQNPAVMTNLQLTYPIQLTREIPVELREVIEKMSYKFPFPKPPNLLSEKEVESILIRSVKGRMQSINECIEVIESCSKNRKLTFWEKLIQVFSIT